MSNVRFPFRMADVGVSDYSESLDPLDDVSRSRGGRAAVIARASYLMFRAAGAVRLPATHFGTQRNPSDFYDFLEARQGRVDTFLYLAEHAHNREVVEAALGTGDNSEDTFAFSAAGLHKHLVAGDHDDEDSLMVYLDGALQTSGYVLSGNDDDPTVTFTSAPGSNVEITVAYLFYMPVRFASSPEPRTLRHTSGDSLARQEVTEFRVEMEEDRPGARYA